MSRYITEHDVDVGYSSDQDDYESELVQDITLSAEPHEIYVGNTGKVNPAHFYEVFKQYGYITDMSIWRTYNHLYHARIVYQKPAVAQRAIEQHNNQPYNGKRLRVSLARSTILLDYATAIRIDDICADCSEEDIYDHFSACGVIHFVIKTGFAAYVQFERASDAHTALCLEMILNGDPYTISRISAQDRVNHVQVIESMKDVKYRKPFVMVENFPLLPTETPLSHYKNCFESIGPVRHFKIAPTGGETVTLALCMEKADDRDLVIDKFNNSMMGGKQLKLYMAPGKARMTIHHAATFALCSTSVVVTGIHPYYKDYDVCKMFRKCGEINFLERYDGKWLICFESYTAVSLTHYYHFMINRQRLKIENLTSETIPVKTHVQLRDAVVKAPEVKKTNLRPGSSDAYMKKALQAMDQEIKKKPLLNPFHQKKGEQKAMSKSETLSNQASLIASLFNNADKLEDGNATTAQAAAKRSAADKPQEAAFSTTTGRIRQDSQLEQADDDENEEDSDKNAAYISNLPKGIEEADIHQLFRPKELRVVKVFFSKDSYHPTSHAFVGFNCKKDLAEAVKNNHSNYRGKRVIIKYASNPENFRVEYSLMVKNLTKNIDEEALLDEIQKVMGPGSVNDIVKPAHHYAYIDFDEPIEKNKALVRLREAFTRFKIDIFPIYRAIPKRARRRTYSSLEKRRANIGLKMPPEIDPADKTYGVHNAHKLFVGNISRDSTAEDVIDYFNNFGQVIDYSPIEKKSCYLRKSVILSFVNAKHAENAYLYQGHFFEGCLLETHLMDIPPMVFRPDVLGMSVKFHSPFLTNDEIYTELRKHLYMVYCMRFDAFDDRANFLLRYINLRKKNTPFDTLSEVKYINDEAVVFTDGIDWSPPADDEAEESRHVGNSRHRKQKEQFLSYVVYKENLKEDLEMRTKPNTEQDVPFKIFYNDNSVQINNVSIDTSLEDIRDLFCKCGNITDYQALVLDEDYSKICYVKFDVDLAADLACTYNQRMVNGKRILVHLAKETLYVERDRSIVVERLNPRSTTENIYDAFSSIGMIKYVQKQTPFTAIVCFKDQDSMIEAVNVTQIQNSGNFVINPCYEDYDPRFLNNFSVKEEYISIEQMRATLKPRILPEYHQSEIERQVFDTLPGDVKTHLLNEVFLARRNIPGFNKMSIAEQITALKTKHPKFTQKEHFMRLTSAEQKQLLKITDNMQEDYPYEETKNMEIAPPPVKQPRNDPPVDKKPDKMFAANWYSAPDANNGHDSYHAADERSQDLPNSAMNAHHVSQALPTSGLLGIGTSTPNVRITGPAMHPMGSPNPGMYSSRGVHPMNPEMMYGGSIPRSMPPWVASRSMGEPDPMGSMGLMGPMGPSELMRSMGPMEPRGPMRQMRSMGQMGMRREGLSGHWAQQMASMAYNAGPPPGQMNCYQQPYFR